MAAYDLTGRATEDGVTRTFASRLLERLRSLPSIEAAAIASSIPLDIHGLPSRVFTVEGWARTEAGFDQALANTVTPGYFAVMGIPLIAGADFVELDRHQRAPAGDRQRGVRPALPAARANRSGAASRRAAGRT